ncbi:MAG: FHA domain-containing protein [Ktedonobacteraceae bacterium]
MDTLNSPPSLGSIQFITGSQAGESFPIYKANITLGRDPASDIPMKDPAVSRHHAKIEWNNGAWAIINVSDRNTVTVNQRNVAPGQQMPINDQDTIILGTGASFLFQVKANVSTTPDTSKVPPPNTFRTLQGNSPSIAPQQSFQDAPYVPQQSFQDEPYIPQQSFPNYSPPEIQPPYQNNPPANLSTMAIPQQSLQNNPPVAPQQSLQNNPQGYLPTMAAPPPPPVQRQNPTIQPIQPMQPMNTQRAPQDVFEPHAGGTANIPRGMPTLEVSSNIHHEKPIYPLDKQIINIGRHPRNDIVVSEEVISLFHAQIVREGDALVFIHPQPVPPPGIPHTTNGILYNGILYPGQTPTKEPVQPFRKRLERGDVFRIGNEDGTLVTLTYNDGSSATQDIVPEIRPIPLGAPQISIGRHPDNNLVLNHPQVSGHHARLERMPNGYRIADLGSTNGVYINARRIANHQMLSPNDEVRIGPFKLTYTGTQLTQHDESNSVRIDAIQLNKAVRTTDISLRGLWNALLQRGNKRTILLNNISLVIPPRKFVALVGGSGTGKSTLMGALNGLQPSDGTVLYNGQDYYKHLAAFSTQLGYVPQDDIIHRDLNVDRALYYAAKLRLPSDFTEAQIKQRINEVLEDVEMSFRRHVLVSKLSGGQRKRVSIALELLANPSVFFLDEPTSGLDPGLDRKMMFLLRKLADKGHTIVLVTHATNNINACDYVCFLCQGGRLAFFGPPDEAKKFFNKTDFAEIYTSLEPTEENKDIPARADARFRESPYYRQYVQEQLERDLAGQANLITPTAQAAVKPPKRGNPLKQFLLLSMRYIELLKNDKVNLSILLLQAPIIALILFLLLTFQNGLGTFDPTSIAKCPTRADITATKGRIVSNDCQRVLDSLNTPQGQQFAISQGAIGNTPMELLQTFIVQGSGGDAQKILFIMAFAAVMFGCINGAREIVKEDAVYRRERTVNLGIMPYMFSKIVVLGILCLLQSLVLVFLVDKAAPLKQGIFLPSPVEIYITMVLTSIAGLMLGLAVSAFAPNNDRASIFIPIILIPQVIFSGIIFPLNTPGLQIIGSFFAARWSMAAMGSTVGLHGDKLGSSGDFAYQGTLFSTSSQGQAIFHLALMWLALVVMIVLLGFLTAYFLKRKDVRH